MLLFARLDHETKPLQRAVDERWAALLAPHVTRSAYVEQLARTYGFELPLETALAHTPRFAAMFNERSRSRLLSRDLFALDYQGLHAIPRRPMASFTNLIVACGWLYVIERSAQSYPMIAGHVLARLPQLANACTYLSDLGAQHRWATLRSVVDGIASTPQIQTQIVEAAVDAFGALAAWYDPEKEALRAEA